MAGLRITRVERVACVSTRSQLAGQHTCLHGDLLHLVFLYSMHLNGVEVVRAIR